MPTYNYQCENCKHEVEVVQKMSDPPLTSCPECKKEELKKVIKSTGGFQLKGNGWFKSGGY
jgi:putative FmdB family regulatory protein